MEKPAELVREAILQRQTSKRELPPATPAAVIPSGHANYSALMQRHDRVRTRHLHGKDGGFGA